MKHEFVNGVFFERAVTNYLSRYYRCKITREQRNTVDVKLLDVGGTERVERMSLIQLPEELKNQPEFGFQCSLGHTVSVNDIRLR